MKVLHFDSVGGASGDMILGALIDLGVEVELLRQGLATLGLHGVHLHAERLVRDGLRGTLCRVEEDVHHEHEHDHHHNHAHDHHDHHHAPHRGLREIEALIRASGLPEQVKAESLRVFGRIGEVEAGLHGTTVDQIHFHEIGAVDSIVDIVGCCLAKHLLGTGAVTVGPLPQGTGTIRCAHGVFPNPAPATVELLAGMEVVQTSEPFELVTPTGAGLLAVWRGEAPARMVARAAGYGFGQRTLSGRPNVLRAVLLETTECAASQDECLVLECNLDDATPEVVGALVVQLLAAGALDVFTVPAFMKKQRPGVLLTVLVEPARREAMLDLLFCEGTTFGVREHKVRRTVLARRHAEVATPAGTVRIKVGTWQGRDVTFAPEFEDCLARARETARPVREVYEQAMAAAQGLRAG